MGSRTLVTVATDGFRDYVELPDGRSFNLGSVSVLKLIAELVDSSAIARKALDTFLKNRRTTVAVDVRALEEMLRPKRSRWAVHEDRFIPFDPRTQSRVANMDAQEATKLIAKLSEEVADHCAKLFKSPAKKLVSDAQAVEKFVSSAKGKPDAGLSKAFSNVSGKGYWIGMGLNQTMTTLQLQVSLGQGKNRQSKDFNVPFGPGAESKIMTHIDGMAKAAKTASEQTFTSKLAALDTLLVELDRGRTSPAQVSRLGHLSRSLLATAVEAAVDEDAKTELELYMDNEGRLYNQKKSILANIMRKMKAGKYDHRLAPKLWMYWVDEGAKMYVREFGGDVKTMFAKDLRESLAKDIADRELKLIEEGEYSSIKVAMDAEAGEGPSAVPSDVQKAEDVTQSDTALYFKLASKWSQKGEKWILDGKGDSIEKAEVQEIKGPGVPLFLLKLYVKDKGAFQAKKEFKKLTDAQKAGESWLKSDADGASLVLTDFKKIASVTGDPEQVAKQMKVDDPYAGKDLSKNDTFYKLADTEIPLINESLAQNVMAKVEGALSAVETSKKANTSLAKQDLHTISTKLATVLQEASLSDPGLRPTLLDLAAKADQIHAHFSPTKGA